MGGTTLLSSYAGSEKEALPPLPFPTEPLPENLNRELWPGRETVRVIGKGNFGVVCEIRREVLGVKESAALKVISIPKDDDEISALRADGMDDQSITSYFHDCVQDLLREYRFMKEVKGHTSIVSCDDFRAISRENGLGWDLYIKMELLTALNTSATAGTYRYMAPEIFLESLTAIKLIFTPLAL